MPLPAISPTSTPPIRPGPAAAATPSSRAGLDAGGRQRAGDQPIDDLDMGARGDLGHHAAISGMGGDLAHHLVGEDFAGPVAAQPHHRRGGLVAGGFDPQNAHPALSIRLARACPGPNERRRRRWRRRRAHDPTNRADAGEGRFRGDRRRTRRAWLRSRDRAGDRDPRAAGGAAGKVGSTRSSRPARARFMRWREADRARLATIPLYVVGARAARAARDAGLALAGEPTDDAAALAERLARTLPPGARLLYLAGRDRKPTLEATLAAAGLVVQAVELYAAEAREAWSTREAAGGRRLRRRAALFASHRRACARAGGAGGARRTLPRAAPRLPLGRRRRTARRRRRGANRRRRRARRGASAGGARARARAFAQRLRRARRSATPRRFPTRGGSPIKSREATARAHGRGSDPERRTGDQRAAADRAAESRLGPIRA